MLGSKIQLFKQNNFGNLLISLHNLINLILLSVFCIFLLVIVTKVLYLTVMNPYVVMQYKYFFVDFF